MNSKKIGNRGFRFLIIGLAVIMGINGMLLVSRLQYRYHRVGLQRSDFERTMKKEDLPEIRRMVYSNRYLDADSLEDTSDYEAISRYYDAAMQYKALTEVGDVEHAANERSRMDAAAADMKSPNGQETLEKIDRQLGIE